MIQEALLLFSEILIMYFLVLGAHALRRRFGLAAFYALLGGITAIMAWVTEMGLMVSLGGVTFVLGSTVFYTSLLLSVFVVYVFDGPRAARIAISTVIGVSILMPAVMAILNVQLSAPSATALFTIPKPNLRTNTASVLTTFVDLIFLGIAWEFLGKNQNIKLWLRTFLTLLGVMGLDVILFSTGAFAGHPEYLSILGGSLISRLIIALFALPFLYAYLDWQQNLKGSAFQERPLLAILKQFDAMKEELTLAQQELQKRKAVEQALRESEQRYRWLFERAPVGIFTAHSSGKLLNLNTHMAALLGFSSPSETLEYTAESGNILCKHAQDWNTLLEQLEEHRSVNNFEIEGEKKHGGTVWLSINARLSPAQEHENHLIKGFATNITERKQEKAELEKSNQRIQMLYKAGRQLGKTLEMDQVYEHTLQIIDESLGCDSMFISSYDDQTQLIHCEWAKGPYGRYDIDEFPPLPLNPEGAGTQSKVISTGQSLYFKDYQKHRQTSQKKYSIKPDSTLADRQEKPQDGLVPQSALMVPLKVEERVIGVLQVFSMEYNSYSLEDLAFLEAFAPLIATAMTNAHLYQQAQFEIQERKKAEKELKKHSDQLDIVRKIGLELIAKHDVAELLDTITAQAMELVSASSGGIALYDAERDCLEFVNYLGLNNLPDKSELKPGEGLTGKVWQAGKPKIVDNYAEWKERSSAWTQAIGQKASIGVPIQWEGTPLGVLVLDHSQPGGFTEKHAEILQLLSAQAAVTIQNARLIEAEKKARQQAEALWETSRALVKSFNLDEVLNLILHQLKRVIPFETASVLILEEGETPHLIVGVGYEDERTTRTEARERLQDSPILERMNRDLQPIVSGDVQGLEGWQWISGAEHVRSWMAVPLIIRENMIGALMVDNSTPHHFSDQDVHITQALAQHAAQAIHNARLFQELQQYTEELEERVQDRTQELNQRVEEVERLNKALMNLLEDYQSSNQRLSETSQQLKKANQELESFTYSVSHDLRAPLRAINGFTQILMDEYQTQLSEEPARYLTKVRQNAKQMDNLIQDLLALSRLGRKAIRKQELDLEEMTATILKEFEERIQARQVSLSVGDLPTCQADRRLMKQVLTNLINNALKFTREESHPTIEIRGETTEDEIIYSIQDNGIGFDMKYADKLFNAFQRLHDPVEYEGTGIGLAIVKRIINRHGGRVWAEASVNQGATFYFTVPIDKKYQAEEPL
jgi:PAS domain S-box-containing protein